MKFAGSLGPKLFQNFYRPNKLFCKVLYSEGSKKFNAQSVCFTSYLTFSLKFTKLWPMLMSIILFVAQKLSELWNIISTTMWNKFLPQIISFPTETAVTWKRWKDVNDVNVYSSLITLILYNPEDHMFQGWCKSGHPPSPQKNILRRP